MRRSHWGSAALGLSLVGLAIAACGLAPIDCEGKSYTIDGALHETGQDAPDAR